MRHFFSHIALLLLLLAFAGSACRTATQTPTLPPTPQVIASGIPAGTSSDSPPETISNDTEGVPVLVELEVGPGDFNFIEKMAGLAGFSSYSSRLVVSFSGTEAGKEKSWSSTHEFYSALESPARLLSITNVGDLSQPEPSLLAEINNTAYQLNGDGSCTFSAIESGQAGLSRLEMREPVIMLHSVLGAEIAGQEKIGEIQANHYTFDQRALVESGITEANGEMWFAVEGGYLLKYTLSAAGNQDYFGEGIEGTITWDYELTAINQTPAPILPDSCHINAPLVSDAINVINLPYWLAFDSALSVTEVSDFYQQQLPVLGWLLQPGAYISGTESFQEYIQGNQTLILSVTMSDGQVTRVNLLTQGIED